MLSIQPRLINPRSAIWEETRKSVERQMDMACEIFIAKQFAKIHYRDLMPDVPEGLATKNRLLSWLNDNNRGKTVRLGVISVYKKDHADDFENGIWHASNFCVFINFMKEKLTDISFVKDKKIADNFANSFKNEIWFNEAVAISGLKLLEDLYEHNALQTKIARAYIEHIRTSREMLNSIRKIIGRSTKNHDAYEMQEILPQIVERGFKQQLKSAFEIFANEPEYKIFEKYRKEIQDGLNWVFWQPSFPKESERNLLELPE